MNMSPLEEVCDEALHNIAVKCYHRKVTQGHTGASTEGPAIVTG